MHKIPKDYKYTKNHEWVRLQEDSSILIGITDYAQESLGDITYLDLPEINTSFQKNAVFGVAESVTATSNLYMPLSGSILSVNPDIHNHPELINDSPYNAGWILLVQPQNINDLSSLLDPHDYLKIITDN